MSEDAETIQTKVAEAKQHITEMKEAVDGLSACWTGPSAEVYKAQVHADIEYMADVCKDLEAFLGSMSEAQKAYDKAESEIHKTISRMWFW